MSAAHAADRLDAAVKLLLEGNSPHTVVADIAARYGCGKRQGRNVVAKAYQQIQKDVADVGLDRKALTAQTVHCLQAGMAQALATRSDRLRYWYGPGVEGVAWVGATPMNTSAEIAAAFDRVDALLVAATAAAPAVALLLARAAENGVSETKLTNHLRLNSTTARWVMKLAPDATTDRALTWTRRTWGSCC
jgi:hypothetical protein